MAVSDLIFRNAAALNDHRGHPVETIDARFDIVRGDFPEIFRRNGIGSQAVTDDRKCREGQAMRFQFGGGGKFGLQPRHHGVHTLQRQHHVGVPIEKQIDFG